MNNTSLKITTGKYEVLYSGSVISYQYEPITFELAPNLKISMKFCHDDESKKPKMDFNEISNTELEILLTNFDNQMGIGNNKPIQLGTFRNRTLHLNFRINSLNAERTNKTVYYTWYLGEIVKNEE